MHNNLRLWVLLTAVVGLIFTGLLVAELQRNWSRAATVLPVTLTLSPAGSLPLDSIGVAALDRKGGRIALPLVNGTWVAADMFVSGLELSLPRSLVPRLGGVTITVGPDRRSFSAAEVAGMWSVSTPDSGHRVYASPASLGTERSRIPGLRAVINWAGDGRFLTQAFTASLWKTALCLLFLGIALMVVPFGRSEDPETGRRRTGRVLLVCCAFALIYGLVFFSILRFPDTADPKGDAWEYQAMAVALVQGHGPNRLGGVEPFETYRFKNAEDDSTDYRAQCAWWGGRFHPYRTPGYPAFLAGVYAVFGISPARAQEAQLALLILVAAFLPFVGFAYWKSVGFYAGIIAGLIFFNGWYYLASIFYAEPLIIFILFLFVLSFLLYERKRTLLRAVLLGFVCGAALLIKGDLIFVPPLVLIYLALQAWKKTIPVRQAAAFAFVCVLTVAPWSFYATRMSGQPVVLSTQGNTVLVEGNNEAVLADGAWHPEYIADPHAFYNREEIRRLPVLQRVMRFYLANPGTILPMVSVKLTSAFGHFPYLRLAVFLILLRLFATAAPAGSRPAARGRTTGSRGWFRAGQVVLALLAVLVSIPFMFAALAGTLFYVWRRGPLRRLMFPASFVVLLLNFLLVTVMVFGDRRFVSVIDCFMILTALRFLLSSVVMWLAPREFWQEPPASAPFATELLYQP